MALEDLLKRTDIPEDVKEQIAKEIAERKAQQERDVAARNDALNRLAANTPRVRAEQKLKSISPQPLNTSQQLLHELSVHQIELEMQNEELRTAQNELERSRERYADLYEFAPAGYITLNDQGRVVEANLTFATMLGIPRRNLLKQPLSRYLQLPGQDTIYLRHKQLLETREPQSYDVRLKKQDGTQFWAHIDETINADGSGKPEYRAIVSDITEHKIIENKLAEKEELLAAYVLNSPIHTFIKEVTPEESRVIIASENFRDLIGTPGAEIVGKTMKELFPTDFAARITADDQAVISRGELLQQEEEFNGRNYSTIKFPIPIGEKNLLAGYTIDITERKQMEEAVRRSEELYHRLFEQSSNAIVIVDTTTGRYVDANRAAEILTGRSKSELTTLKISEVAPNGAEKRLELLVNTLGSIKIGEVEYVRPDGTIRTAVLTATRIDKEQVFETAQDITERKQTELYRDLGREVLQILNEPRDIHESIDQILTAIKTRTGIDAVGIRLQEGNDFPYFVQQGFSKEFLTSENSLVATTTNGQSCKDKDHTPLFECTCGLVISGKTDPSNPLFTRGGSAMTNNSFSLLEIPADQDPRFHPRNQCIYQGYASIALVPIKTPEKIVGLIQLNDRRENRFTPNEIETLEGIAAHIGSALTRKHAEEALRESEERFREILENSLDASYKRNLQTQKYDYLSTAFTRISGHTPAEINEASIETIVEFIHPDDRAIVAQVIAESLTGPIGKPYRVEYRSKHKDGEYRWLHDQFTVMRDDQERPLALIGSVGDITARKKTEEQLHYANHFLDSIIETIPIMLFLKDAQTLRFVRVNKAGEKLLGIPKEELLGKNDYDFFPRKQADEFTKHDRDVLNSGTMIDIPEETLQTRHQGVRLIHTKKVPILNANGEPEYLLGISEDITEHKKAEEQLKEVNATIEQQNQLMTSLLKNLPIGVLMVEAPSQKLLMMNDQARNMLGQGSAENLSAGHIYHVSRAIKRGNREQYPAEERPIMQGMKGLSDHIDDLVIIRPDGSECLLEAYGTPVKDTNGNVWASVASLIDITDRERVKDALLTRERLSAVGELASGVAHDFNNTLQVIVGNIELAKLEDDVPEVIAEYLSNIKKCATTAAARVQHLQRFAGKGKIKQTRESVNLNALIDETLEQAKPTWKSTPEKNGYSIEIKKDYASIPSIDGNTGELSSAIYNLIKNSVEAMPKGGTLSFETGSKDDKIYVRVKDTGEGMPEEGKRRAFQPFYSTKGLDLGRGLGLSAVYTIMQEHHAEIAIKETAVGKGTTIEMLFSVKPPASGSIRNATAGSTTSHPARVLWVDDDETVTYLGSHLLKKIGNDVDSAESGEDALEMLKKKPYDLLITDIGMPRMSGWDLVRTIKGQYPEMKRAIASGWEHELTPEQKSYGVDYVLVKPATREDLEMLLRGSLKGKK